MINWFKKKFKLFEDGQRDHLINVKSLAVNYGKHKVLDKVSFNLDNRDIFGIIGLSGSGKTTILKALMKLVRYNGLIEFSDKIKRIGYCPQDNAFLEDLTIEDNALIMGSLLRVDNNTINNRLNSYMKDLMLNEPLNKPAAELSGGQKKRFNIILSLLHDPQLIIMDEPFAGLDFLNRSLLWYFILKLRRRGKTVVLTTHLLDEAEKYCNQILIISNGRRFALGSINALKRRFNFNYYMRVRFDYLNKNNLAKLKDFCSKRDSMIIELIANYAGFSIPNELFKKELEDYFQKLKLDYSIIEYRPPTLNDLFMVSSK